MLGLKKLIKKNKKILYSILILLLLIVVISPLFLNFLLISWRSSYAFGSTSDWIGLWGVVLSSILGGIISGGLTLLGVILTIQRTERRDFLKRYSETKTKIDEILMETVGAVRILRKCSEGSCDFESLIKYLENKTSNFSMLMKIASDVRYELYEDIRFYYVMELEVLLNLLRNLKWRHDEGLLSYREMLKKFDLLNFNEIEDQLNKAYSAAVHAQKELNKEYEEIR